MMFIKSSADEVIPEDYNDLQRQYGTLIYKTLLKANKVDRNFEDLLGYVWMKLLEARLLDRFKEHVQRQIPKVLTALQVCDFFGISWSQWIVAMGAYHKGVPSKYRWDGKIIARKKGRWMPTPINLAEFKAQGLAGYASKDALFDLEDIVKLSLDEKRLKNGNIRGAFLIMGREVRDGVIVGGERPEGYLKFPEVKTTRTQFKNYLLRAVMNHYANFCRTQNRKHKERPQISTGEEAIIWENTLPDSKAVGTDNQVALKEAQKLLSETLREYLEGIQSDKEIEEYELEIFTSLGDGTSLMRALRNSDLPPKICKSIFETVRPRVNEFR